MSTVLVDKLKSDFTSSFEKERPLTFNAYREKMSERFDQIDFPTQKDEAWKYVKLNKLQKEKYSIQSSTKKIDIDRLIINSENSILVFVNGFFRKDLSSIKDSGAIILSESNASELENESESDLNFFSALNAIYFVDGVIIKKLKNQEIKPIEIIFITEGNQIFAPVKNKIQVEGGANLTLYFTYFSESSNAFVNSNTAVELEKNAQLTLNVLQIESSTTHHYNLIDVNQKRDSVFTINTHSLSGNFIRNDLRINSNDENTLSNLNGLYLLNDFQFVDNHTVMDHKSPNCLSNELYKGVIDGNGTAVFNGKVFVRPDAQKINAFQSNANILLSDDATINSKPELEIYADDVKCSHGSTTGQIDEEALFYLRARGISEISAKRLLIAAFASEVINKIECELFRFRVEDLVAEYFKE